MSPGLQRKLEQLAERHEEVGRLLAEPEVLADNNRFRTLSREFAQLEPVVGALAELSQAQRDLEAARAMRNDPEMRELAEEEIPAAEARIAELDERLQLLLIPVDPRDEGNLFVEIRAGTGGDEAAIFAGDLFRMYAR
jgi:peptide chain release factor 1